jgi:hypothetical protein
MTYYKVVTKTLHNNDIKKVRLNTCRSQDLSKETLKEIKVNLGYLNKPGISEIYLEVPKKEYFKLRKVLKRQLTF